MRNSNSDTMQSVTCREVHKKWGPCTVMGFQLLYPESYVSVPFESQQMRKW